MREGIWTGIRRQNQIPKPDYEFSRPGARQIPKSQVANPGLLYFPSC
jgi:hypothetical protein